MRCARIPAAPGRFRGGLGCEQVVQARHDIRFNSQMDRGQVQAVGPRGRALRAWATASRSHRFGKTEEQRFHNGKALNQVLHAGDAYILRSGGGGGFGSPLDRDSQPRARRALRLREPGGGRAILRRGVPATAQSSTWRRPKRGAPRCAGRDCRTTSRSPIPACRCPRPRTRTTTRTRSSPRRSGGAGDDRTVLLVAAKQPGGCGWPADVSGLSCALYPRVHSEGKTLQLQLHRGAEPKSQRSRPARKLQRRRSKSPNKCSPSQPYSGPVALPAVPVHAVVTEIKERGLSCTTFVEGCSVSPSMAL